MPAASDTTFDPAAVDAFVVDGWELDAPSGAVDLHYRLADVAFTERIDFGPLPADLPPARRAALERALDLLALVAGVSYFKAADPPAVIGGGAAHLTPAVRELLTALYGEGLAEFRSVNGRPVGLVPAFPAAVTPPAPAPAGLGASILVPVGGGKDSVVTLETLRARFDVVAFSVGTPAPVLRTVAVAGVPHRIARRTIAPSLLDLNGRGALNGHVPVTAIVSMIAVCAAILDGLGTVAMSNERSADIGSFVAVDGTPVNHQFSKGARAEQLLRAAIAEAVCPDLEYVSFLRPLSELAIARSFATMRAYHGAFTSCNAVFRLDARRRASSWCCDCPKCRFVYLILAPYLAPEDLLAIFGEDLLDDTAHLAEFEALVGLRGDKPFECVGEIGESQAALRAVAADPRWAGRRVVEELAPRLPAAGEAHADAVVSDAYPDRFREALDAVLGA